MKFSESEQKRQTIFDIIIIGAGPAGATFARLASRKYKILLIDKKRNRGKCCGGLIAPDAQKILAGFDIGLPKNIISDPQLFYVRSIDLNTKNEGKYQRHYMNIDRKKFDDYLLSLIGNRVKINTNCRYLSHNSGSGGIIVKTENNGKTEEYGCKLLVGADGAFSRVRKNQIGDFKSLNKYMALQGQYKKNSEINCYAALFDKSLTDFYSWLVPKDENLIIGGAFKDSKRALEKFNILETRIRESGYDFGKLEKLEACYLLRPRLKDIKLGNNNVALIGEAAGFISPSSAEGLSYAFRSAMKLNEALGPSIQGWKRRYKKGTLSIKANIFIKNIKSLFIYNSFLRNLIFKTGISTIKRG